ncbi:MAG TPA: putative O-glycosylation ligase, exosortase A system-associated [Candidatus Cybelea sp.]|nr:putative O-glycosylation ligase, exosortase A system-associated [Candidatus Cybelea sp.]
MRALLFDILLVLALPATLALPHLGILVYYWISFMSPQQLLWESSGIPWSKLLVAVTLLAIPFSAGRRKLPLNLVTLTLVAFLSWCTVTSFFATYPALTWDIWADFAKIVLMTLVCVYMMGTRERLTAIIWTIVISLGYYTVKGGIFVLLTAGNYHVLGPPGSPFSETNGMARAAIMILPLMYYLALHSAQRYVRIGMYVAICMTVLAMVGTGSRGGFLGFLAAVLALFAYSRHKVRMLVGAAILVVASLVILPEERISGWTGRMETIESYQEDESAQSRFQSWQYAESVVEKSPIMGGGFGAFRGNIGLTDDPDFALDAHSNYYQILGDQGYVGLALYLLLGLAALGTQFQIFWRARHQPELYWARDLAILLQVDTVGYFVGGLTITHPYLELYYALLSITVICSTIVKQKLVGAPSDLPSAPAIADREADTAIASTRSMTF